MQVQAYLNFDGRCEAALEFYRRPLGAEIEALRRLKQCPEPGMIAPGMEEKVMHSTIRIGDTAVMASDGRCTGKAGFQGISLSLSVASPSEAEKVFTALADGGKVQMPLAKTFFSSSFGMLTDRFGVTWMVIVGL